MKKSAKGLYYFGLHCSMLEFLHILYSTHGPSSKEQLLTLSYFWSPVCVESLAVDPVKYTKDFSFIKGAKL
jgi:hypothetical protein